MDEKSLEYSMSVLDDIREALEPMGMSLEKLDPEQTRGIPTGILRMGAGGGWEISCNVVPTHRDSVSTTFVQLYVQLTPPSPQWREELERYAAACNASFLLGTLLVFQDCLCMKYVMALEPTIALEESHVQAAVFAFCQQAEDFARQGNAIAQGTRTVEEALTSHNR